jgi:hypothetical protein
MYKGDSPEGTRAALRASKASLTGFREGMTMRIDRYIRTLLTIIAACLVWLCVSHATAPVVYAQSSGHVFMGSELGYRVDSFRPGVAPMGTLVVKIDGVWYEARLAYFTNLGR